LQLARRAVQQSLVLLRNDRVLPISKSARIVVAGAGADSLTLQAGGWTVRWQGAEDEPFVGTTLLAAIRAAVSDPAQVTYSRFADQIEGADVAILVMSELSYAEWFGDSFMLEPLYSDRIALDKLQASRLPVVVVLLTGRPLVIEPLLDKASAWVVAWLPGSAGEGVADVLFGDYTPTGTLAHSWPRSIDDVPINVGDTPYDPLFPYGFGLTYTRAR
jgi:beta-glucosidase